ncbi:hypothetical protein GCM10022271_21930 [Corallibacter vietnamensis]|uniref:Uncharacterized protein n=1 Tax=Corallibacter vietnamensis TaxID=904130 RepID=A0ABP7HHB4_9FLAO
MLLTITITLATLVVLNFFLLVFSCNKTKKSTKKVDDQYLKIVHKPTKQSVSSQLAATGS